MRSDSACVSLPPALSATRAVKFAVPAAVGVPVIAPVLAPRVRPAGSAPADTVQVTGATVPLADKVPEYAVPNVPAANDVVVIAGLELPTLILRGWVSMVPSTSCTATVNEEAPVRVGVPLMTPAPLNVRPAGSVPTETDHVYGVVPPIAARVCEYAAPAVAAGKAVVVILSGLPAPINAGTSSKSRAAPCLIGSNLPSRHPRPE
jgi:hypothetical protein